jgi:hypothetical protein
MLASPSFVMDNVDVIDSTMPQCIKNEIEMVVSTKKIPNRLYSDHSRCNGFFSIPEKIHRHA